VDESSTQAEVVIKRIFSLSKASTGRGQGLARTRALIAINTTQSRDYSAKVFLMPQPRKKTHHPYVRPPVSDRTLFPGRSALHVADNLTVHEGFSKSCFIIR